MQDQAQQYLTIAEAARLAPGHPSPSALWRWTREGLKRRSGRRVRLRSIRAGRAVYTTAEWLRSFFEETRAADLEQLDDDEAGERGLSRAEEELDAAGLR